MERDNLQNWTRVWTMNRVARSSNDSTANGRQWTRNGGNQSKGSWRYYSTPNAVTVAPKGQPQDSPRQRLGFQAQHGISPERAYQWMPIVPRWCALSGLGRWVIANPGALPRASMRSPLWGSAEFTVCSQVHGEPGPPKKGRKFGP